MWQLIFWLVEAIFFRPSWYTPATANFIFPSRRNVFLKVFCLVESDFLASENSSFYRLSEISAHDLCRCQTFMPVYFSSSENVVLKQILHSGHWKRIFRLVETICSNISNIPSIGSSFSVSWKYILNESYITATGNGFSVCWKRYSFIQIFLESIIAIKRKPIFFKKILFLLLQRKPFSSTFFSDTDSN